jgi:hypothetical protein
MFQQAAAVQDPRGRHPHRLHQIDDVIAILLSEP